MTAPTRHTIELSVTPDEAASLRTLAADLGLTNPQRQAATGSVSAMVRALATAYRRRPRGTAILMAGLLRIDPDVKE